MRELNIVRMQRPILVIMSCVDSLQVLTAQSYASLWVKRKGLGRHSPEAEYLNGLCIGKVQALQLGGAPREKSFKKRIPRNPNPEANK